MSLLIVPDVAYGPSFLDGLREFQAAGGWQVALDYEAVAADVGAFILTQAARPNCSEWWAVHDRVFVGRLGLKHVLTEELRKVGGNIGYDVRPAFRNRGFATGMLREGLGHARAAGLDRVLLTCDDTNVASIRVIEKCGGVLEKRVPPKLHYWIQTPAGSPTSGG